MVSRSLLLRRSRRDPIELDASYANNTRDRHLRVVEHISEIDGRQIVFWHTDGFYGAGFHTYGRCTLATFQRWARYRIVNEQVTQ